MLGNAIARLAALFRWSFSVWSDYSPLHGQNVLLCQYNHVVLLSMAMFLCQYPQRMAANQMVLIPLSGIQFERISEVR